MKKIISFCTILMLLLAGSFYHGTAKADSNWSTFTTFGTNTPIMVTVDATGNVYVLVNNQIEKFSSDGTLLSHWDSGGGKKFSFPSGIKADNEGNVYLADTNNNRIVKFKSDGTYITEWGSSASPYGFLPTDIAVDNDGNLYVANGQNYQVLKFKTDGTYVSSVDWQSSNDPIRPYGIAVDTTGNVYVGDTWHSQIVKLKPDLSLIKTLSTKASEANIYLGPLRLAVDSAGNIYETDYYTIESTSDNRVIEYSPDGTVINVWNKTIFNNPLGIAVNPAGDVYVADSYNYRILVLKSAASLREGIVRQSYQNAFGRTPSNDEITYWKGRTDWRTLDDLEKLHSKYLTYEPSARKEVIANAIKAVYGWSALDHEVKYWDSFIAKNGTLYKNFVSILQDLHQKDSLIQQSYQEAFGRSADTAEVKTLIGNNKYQSLSQLRTINHSVIMTIVNEDIRKNIVNNAFLQVTGQKPSDNMLNSWSGKLASGGEFAGMFYNDLLIKISNRGTVVREAILDVFDATASDEVIDSWMNDSEWTTQDGLEKIFSELLQQDAASVKNGNKNTSESLAIYVIKTAYQSAYSRAPKQDELNSWIEQVANSAQTSTYQNIKEKLLSSHYTLYQRRSGYDYKVAQFKTINDAISKGKTMAKTLVADDTDKILWDNLSKYHLYQYWASDHQFHFFKSFNEPLSSAVTYAKKFDHTIIIESNTGKLLWDNYFDNNGTDDSGGNKNFVMVNGQAQIIGMGLGINGEQQVYRNGPESIPVSLSSLIAPNSVITSGGGNVITSGGANVITIGGANVITAGGGNIVSKGGGSVITAGGGNVITAGGANVITIGGAN